MKKYDLIIVGAGAAGMMAAITASRQGSDVLVLEKLSKIGAKLKATGGGRCNLSNTLSNEEFMAHFGREGRFMTPALNSLNHKQLQNFFKEIGVETHAPDGFRIFPIGHSSSTIIEALKKEMQQLNVQIACNQRVILLEKDERELWQVVCEKKKRYVTKKIIVATGGMGYPSLGAEGDGYSLAKSLGHKITEIHPAMMPLQTKERWGVNCRADTLPKVELRVEIKKYKKLHALGDLIFTKSGIRGPVVLDFSREITPLLAKFKEVPIVMNLTKGMNEEEIRMHFKIETEKDPNHTLLSLVETLLPSSISIELCKLANVSPESSLKSQKGEFRDKLIKILAWTPLTVSGHDGFKMAMITRGGISLKEIDPNTMQSKKHKNLYFCGEVMNLDGPCGGYNLQWSFSSGYLAGKLL